MGVGRVGSSSGSRLLVGTLASAFTALALAGCSGSSGLSIPSLGAPTSTLNIPAKPDLAGKEASPGDARVARSRLSDATTLAAARSNPRDVEAAMSAARILRRQGDKSNALALLDTAASAAPGDARLLRDRGLLALELGAVARARDHLNRAVAGGSRDWQTHSALGTALAASGKQKEAQRAFAEALKLAPDNPVVLNNLALSLALDGRRGESEQMLRRAAAGARKGSEARVARNLALVSRISERGNKAAGTPATPKQGAAPAVKGAKKAEARSLTRTAQAD